MKPKTDWIPILVTSIIFLFCTSTLLYVMSERRKEDAEYFKQRMVTLETRMNNMDKRIDSIDHAIGELNKNTKEIAILTTQLNSNVIENTKNIEALHERLKPQPKPKTKAKPQKPYIPPIQGPTPVPPVHSNKGIPHIEGKREPTNQ